MQAVVLEQHRDRRVGVALETDQLSVIAQAAVAAALQSDDQFAVSDFVAGRIDVGASGQWCGFVEESTGESDDFVATHFVVAFAFFRAAVFADRVGAVEGVVQRAPAGVRGVEREARIHHRHDQLRAGGAGDFIVDVLRRRLEISRFW